MRKGSAVSEPAYLQLEPDVEQAIAENLRCGRMHPQSFPDDRVLRREDNPHDEATLTRPAFSRDIDKIMNIPAYNRYAGKTQVFSLVENDDICRRGLHVQLVGRIARNIGRLLGLNCQLIEAIALGHDLGHTPFGHAGEKFLSKCLQSRTGRCFHHNVHSVRVMDRLYPRNISLQVLDGALCHNGEFAQQVLRQGDTESFEQLDALVYECALDESAIKRLRPSTLEGCVVRLADMIAYLGKDRDDAMAMGVLPSLDGFETEIIGRDNARIINNITVDVVNHSLGQDDIRMSRQVFEDIKRAKRQNYERIYDCEGWRAGSGNAVGEMFEDMYDRLLTDLQAGDERSPVVSHHANQLATRSRSITVEDYLAQTDRDQVVVDYMASMTDRYFMELYRYLFPNSEKHILARGYCADLPPIERNDQ